VFQPPCVKQVTHVLDPVSGLCRGATYVCRPALAVERAAAGKAPPEEWWMSVHLVGLQESSLRGYVGHI
jgi:hypothetical protein